MSEKPMEKFSHVERYGLKPLNKGDTKGSKRLLPFFHEAFNTMECLVERHDHFTNHVATAEAKAREYEENLNEISAQLKTAELKRAKLLAKVDRREEPRKKLEGHRLNIWDLGRQMNGLKITMAFQESAMNEHLRTPKDYNKKINSVDDELRKVYAKFQKHIQSSHEVHVGRWGDEEPIDHEAIVKEVKKGLKNLYFLDFDAHKELFDDVERILFPAKNR